MVVFSTTFGELLIELYPDKAPLTVENFLAYVDAGFYNGTIFHRIVPGFVVQGGGFTENMEQKATRPPIKNEADNGSRNERGTLSMARTQDVNSATTQFFINLQDNASLDHGSRDFGYAVFGKVIEDWTRLTESPPYRPAIGACTKMSLLTQSWFNRRVGSDCDWEGHFGAREESGDGGDETQ